MIYLVGDTETTDATENRGVCEIGWVLIDENWNILETVESLIDPEKDISPAASGIHGLTYDDVKHSPTLEEFFTLSDAGCYGKRFQGPVTLIGHRIGFDRPAFEPYIDGEVFELDTLRYVRKLYPDADNHQLSTMKFQLNLPKDAGAAHRVLADVMVTYHLAKHISERMNLTLPQLAEHARQPMLIKTLPFGKHKGQPISEVPKSYLSWMKREMQLDFDTQHTINTILGAKT